MLANASPRRLPWQVVRLFLGSLLRVLGFLAVRSVGEALDELAAVLSLYSRPGQVRAARRARAERRAGEPHDVRHLLAPPWLPYRHGLDFVTDLAAAATNQAQDVAERRRAARAGQQVARDAAAGRGPRAPRRGRRGGLPAGQRPGGPLLHQPRRRRAGPLRRPGRRGRPRPPSARSPVARCRRCPRTSPTGGSCTCRRGTPSGSGTDVPAPAYVLPFAFVGSLLGSRCRRVGADAAGRSLRGLGRVAAADRRRPPRRHPRHAALAARVGGGDLRTGARHVGGVGRGPLRHRRGRRAAAVDRPRRARLRRPRPRPALAGGVAHRAARRPQRRLRARACGSSPCWPPPSCSAWPPSSPRGCCATVTAGARRSPPWRRCRCCWPRGSSRWSRRPGAGPAARGRSPARRPGRRHGPAHRPARRRRRTWWLGALLGLLALLALVPRSTRVPVLACWLVALAAAVVVAALGLVTLELPGHPDPAEPGPVRRHPPGLAVVATVLGAEAYLNRLHDGPRTRCGSGSSPGCSPPWPRSSRWAAWCGGWSAPTTTR